MFVDEAELAERFASVVAELDAGRRFVARQQLRQLLREVRPGTTGHILTCVFAAALAPLVDGDSSALDDVPATAALDVYLRDFDVPHIELFELAARSAPDLAAAIELVDRTIAAIWRGQPRVALIDVGFGSGYHVEALLNDLARWDALPTTLELVAIEPVSWALAAGVDRIRRCAAQLDVELDLHPVCAVAEELGEDEWRHLGHQVHAPPVLHAAFSLHHVTPTARARLMSRMRHAQARALVIAEADRAPLADDLGVRFEQCWRYLRARFDVLEAAPIADQDRRALQICYYGRELVELLGPPARNTLHAQSAASWRTQVQGAGFEPFLDTSEVLALAPPVVLDTATPGIARLGTETSPLLTVVGGLHVARREEVLDPRQSRVALRGVALRRVAVRSVPLSPPDLARASLIMRLDAVPRPLDVDTYLAALVAVAEADGHVDELERAFVERQASLLHTSLPELGSLPPLDAMLADPARLDARTRKAIVRDLVFLARIDGHYDARERALVRRIAHRLGHDEAWVERLERIATVPEVLGDTPSWFQEYWFLGTK